MQTEILKNKDPVVRLFAFIQERYSIFLKRQEGQPPPWTNDPVLMSFRFCNVYREDDKVTKWIRENWRDPNTDDPELWFAMCLARTFNLPEALEVIGYPVPFDKVRNQSLAKKILRYRKEGRKIFNAAYIISPGGMGPLGTEVRLLENKLAYVWQNMILLWDNRKMLRPKEGDTLNSFHMLLGQMQGFGSFMSAQVVADIKYHKPLLNASDWWTFAASGPGSRRGLNSVLGRDVEERWNEDEWRLELDRLRTKLLPMFERANMPVPHAQDIQNCLCEWSKYHKATVLGKRPKQLYRGGAAA